MSLARKKEKEAKGRGKLLPKLKTILANPYNSKCPELNADEETQLEQILSTAISSSGEKPQAFATAKRIRLGLESTLRAINNRQCSCVFISLSIKPRCLVSLIARNVEIKDKTVPVYVQPQLEHFTERVFGVKALALVLPTIAEMRRLELCDDLMQWVEARRKPAKVKLLKTVKSVKPVKKIKKQRIVAPATTLQSAPTIKEEQIESTMPTAKILNENYISFSDATELDFVVDAEEDAMKLESTLNMVLQNTSKQAQPELNKVVAQRPPETAAMEIANDSADDAELSDSDDFLPAIEYQPLIVHKIRPNPQKKPKKKRNKNKQKKK